MTDAPMTERATALAMLRLRQAALDVVIQEGRYHERDGTVSKMLAVVPKAALEELRAALSMPPSHYLDSSDDVRGET